MERVTAYLGLGTNLGDREANLRETLQLLQRYGEVLVVSSIYETAPWGYLDQPDFLNCVCAIATQLDPRSPTDRYPRCGARAGTPPELPFRPTAHRRRHPALR